MLTDAQIEEIAKPYKGLMGDHWSYEIGMHEDNIDEFARDIEKAVLLNVRADIIAAISMRIRALEIAEPMGWMDRCHNGVVAKIVELIEGAK